MEAEQAERAAEEARLRELYPLPEDDQAYEEEFEEDSPHENDQVEDLQEDNLISKEERKR